MRDAGGRFIEANPPASQPVQQQSTALHCKLSAAAERCSALRSMCPSALVCSSSSSTAAGGGGAQAPAAAPAAGCPLLV